MRSEHKFQGDHPQAGKATHPEQAHLWASAVHLERSTLSVERSEVSGFPFSKLTELSVSITCLYSYSLFCSLDFLPLHCEKCPLSIAETLSGSAEVRMRDGPCPKSIKSKAWRNSCHTVTESDAMHWWHFFSFNCFYFTLECSCFTTLY